MFSGRKRRSITGLTDLSSSSVSIPDVTADAVARYENNSHAGTTWYDLMPNPANGTDGTIGAAFTWPNFNGESFVTFGQPAKLNFATNFSVVAWYNQDVDPPRQGNERILSRDGINAGRAWLVSQDDTTGLNQAFVFNGVPPSGYTNPQASGAYNTGTFHMVVLVLDASNTTAYVYVDGVVRVTKAGQGLAVPAWPAKDTEAGRHQLSINTTDYFTGQIDTVRFYDRALSPEEILRDYNVGKPAHP